MPSINTSINNVNIDIDIEINSRNINSNDLTENKKIDAKNTKNGTKLKRNSHFCKINTIANDSIKVLK